MTPARQIATSAFIRSEWRFMLYGILMSLWSSFGQTFFISLFSYEIRSDLGLSHGAFGSYYAIATTLSACTLFWLGKLADSVSVPRLSLMTMGAVCLAAMHFSTVSGVASLCFGIYLLRLSGQGMMYHVFSTAMGRRYQAARGRALAFSGFGMNIGEAIFPVLVILALGFIDWRLIWLILPVLAFTSFAPVIPVLCQRTKYQDGPGRDGPVSDSAITQIDDSAQTDMPEIRRYQVKGDVIFWAVIIWLMMIPGFVITGLFFHQIHIAQLKEVPLWAWSANYIWYAIAAIGGAVLSGIMIDRFSAHKIASFVQIFLLVAIIMLYLAETPFWLAVFFVLFGASGGVMQPVINALLAERYGTRWLGEIKALASPLNVFSSALSPAVMGWMIDSGFGLDGLSVMLAAMAGINIIMPFIWFNLLDRTSFTPK